MNACSVLVSSSVYNVFCMIEFVLLLIYLSSLSHMVGKHIRDGFAARRNYPNKVTEHSNLLEAVLRIRIPNSYFLELSDNFLGKKFYNSLKFGPNFFLQQFKNKIILNFLKFVATKKCMTNIFFSPLSFVAVFRSRIRDPGSEIRGGEKSGSKINIPDSQHCLEVFQLFIN